MLGLYNMALADAHLLGAHLVGDEIGNVHLNGKGQIQQPLLQRQLKRAVGGIQGDHRIVRLGLHRQHLSGQQAAGGHQRIAGDPLLNVFIDRGLHPIHPDGIGQLGSRPRPRKRAARAKELHSKHDRQYHHHDDHQQVHSINLSKKPSLFVYHLLQPPRL